MDTAPKDTQTPAPGPLRAALTACAVGALVWLTVSVVVVAAALLTGRPEVIKSHYFLLIVFLISLGLDPWVIYLLRRTRRR